MRFDFRLPSHCFVGLKRNKGKNYRLTHPFAVNENCNAKDLATFGILKQPYLECLCNGDTYVCEILEQFDCDDEEDGECPPAECFGLTGAATGTMPCGDAYGEYYATCDPDNFVECTWCPESIDSFFLLFGTPEHCKSTVGRRTEEAMSSLFGQELKLFKKFQSSL